MQATHLPGHSSIRCNARADARSPSIGFSVALRQGLWHPAPAGHWPATRAGRHQGCFWAGKPRCPVRLLTRHGDFLELGPCELETAPASGVAHWGSVQAARSGGQWHRFAADTALKDGVLLGAPGSLGPWSVGNGCTDGC